MLNLRKLLDARLRTKETVAFEASCPSCGDPVLWQQTRNTVYVPQTQHVSLDPPGIRTDVYCPRCSALPAKEHA